MAQKRKEKKLIIQVRVSPADKKWIEKQADKMRLSVSSYIRLKLLPAEK